MNFYSEFKSVNRETSLATVHHVYKSELITAKGATAPADDRHTP
jgi:hypothetical protein